MASTEQQVKGCEPAMLDGVSFSYNKENGIVFSAPDSYVKKMIHTLRNCYGCGTKPIINEYK